MPTIATQEHYDDPETPVVFTKSGEAIAFDPGTPHEDMKAYMKTHLAQPLVRGLANAFGSYQPPAPSTLPSISLPFGASTATGDAVRGAVQQDNQFRASEAIRARVAREKAMEKEQEDMRQEAHDLKIEGARHAAAVKRYEMQAKAAEHKARMDADAKEDSAIRGARDKEHLQTLRDTAAMEREKMKAQARLDVAKQRGEHQQPKNPLVRENMPFVKEDGTTGYYTAQYNPDTQKWELLGESKPTAAAKPQPDPWETAAGKMSKQLDAVRKKNNQDIDNLNIALQNNPDDPRIKAHLEFLTQNRPEFGTDGSIIMTPVIPQQQPTAPQGQERQGKDGNWYIDHGDGTVTRTR